MNIDTDYTESIDSDMLESLSYSVCKLRHKRQIHINTDFTVTVWMLCLITHIDKYEKYHSHSDHRKQVKNVTKKIFHGVPEDKMDVTKDIFWTEYTEFNNKDGSFDADEFIWKSKDIRDGNSNFWHQKYSLPCTKVLNFVACRVTSKVIGIGAADRSWGDISSDV